MKTSSAQKMILQAGSRLQEDPRYHRGLIARFGYYNIELTDQDGEIIAISVAPAHAQPDLVTDHYPGTYFPTLTKAIQYVIPRQIDGNPRQEDPMAEETKGTHGGRRIPGPGKKLGPAKRTEPKSKPIWCGQISDEQRQLIIDYLTPDERLAALLAAAEAKKARSS